MNGARRRAFRLFLLLALVAALWALAVAATGGVDIGRGIWRFRTRNPGNELLTAVAAVIAASLILPSDRRARRAATPLE